MDNSVTVFSSNIYHCFHHNTIVGDLWSLLQAYPLQIPCVQEFFMPAEDFNICLAVLTVKFHHVDVSLTVFFKHTISYCTAFFIIDLICCCRHILLGLPGIDMYSLCQQWVMVYHMIAHSCQHTIYHCVAIFVL